MIDDNTVGPVLPALGFESLSSLNFSTRTDPLLAVPDRFRVSLGTELDERSVIME